MQFGLTAEQEQLADAQRSWLARHNPVALIRQAPDGAPVRIDPHARSHASQAGLPDLLTAEVGGTHMDLAVCSEVHGYAASSLPIADIALGRWLLERAEIEQADDALVGVARATTASTHPVPMAADMDSIAVIVHDGERERVCYCIIRH